MEDRNMYMSFNARNKSLMITTQNATNSFNNINITMNFTNSTEYIQNNRINQKNRTENKTIYMTYKKQIPDFVFDRWKKLNPNYNIKFYLDKDCVSFLKEHFNDYIANLFNEIPLGMYKADLWRLCVLYVYGGVYADVDLVPYLNIDHLDKTITFYSCLSLGDYGIFQAFIANFSKPKSPLILIFLLSFLWNKPYNIANCVEPTIDMYKCLTYILNTKSVMSDTRYNTNDVKIQLEIGSSINNNKQVNLYYFPQDVDFEVRIKSVVNSHKFAFTIENNILNIQRIDEDNGWDVDLTIDIIINTNESIYLFKEKNGKTAKFTDIIVTCKGNKILDSRDPNYSRNNGW